MWMFFEIKDSSLFIKKGSRMQNRVSRIYQDALNLDHSCYNDLE